VRRCAHDLDSADERRAPPGAAPLERRLRYGPPQLANAIVIAQRAGETDEEIAHVTGYTVPMIRAVLRSS